VLVKAGLEACRLSGVDTVLVLGSHQYYPKFGFSAELAARFKSPYSPLGEHWMAIELKPGILSDLHGTVSYSAPFDKLE